MRIINLDDLMILITSIILVIINLAYICYLEYIFGEEIRSYENINDDIYIVHRKRFFFKELITSKNKVEQNHLFIIEQIGNESIARYSITGEYIAVYNKEGKWLVF